MKEKYRRNVEAIQLLKQLEEENRQADRFEQETLSNMSDGEVFRMFLMQINRTGQRNIMS
mgnify:CR=1 FL=1